MPAQRKRCAFFGSVFGPIAANDRFGNLTVRPLLAENSRCSPRPKAAVRISGSAAAVGFAGTYAKSFSSSHTLISDW